MERMPISQDDLQDVMEMTQKIEAYIGRTLKGQEKCLGVSALFSAAINSAMSQCDTMQDVISMRSLCMCIFDQIICDIKIKE